MANPFEQRDSEEEKAYKKMIVSCVAAASLVVLLFLVVLYQNVKTKQREEKRNERQLALQEAANEQDDFVLEEKNIVSSDLDFWDMYDEDTIAVQEEEGETTPYKKGEPVSEDDKEKSNDKSESLNKEPVKDKGSSDMANDDENHLAVTDNNGKTMYYEILSTVDRTSYDLKKNLTTDDNGRKSYSDDKTKAVLGVDLSQYDGTADFTKAKADGINFAILRIASRGYNTGIITLDEKFVEYANACNANNIYIGTYFTSQAITEQEAIEEASYAVGAVKNFNVRYPVAIDLSAINKEQSRSANLSMKDRTAIVKAFCDTVKQYGFKPVIRGTRDCLISKLNLEDLNSYDFWLLDEVQETDYPYEYTIWQYSKSGTVDGFSKGVDMNLCFVNYEER